MYKNKIVCALKHNNAPLIEDKDTVFIPFNTEYSIFLKNMNDTIAYISIFIDGKDINPGKKIKLYPKCTATVEKFPLTNHRFTFKERTKALQEVRVNQDEDGLIRLEVSFQVKTYKNGNSILDKINEIKPCRPNPYQEPFIPQHQPYNPMMDLYKGSHFEDGLTYGANSPKITSEVNSIKATLNEDINLDSHPFNGKLNMAVEGGCGPIPSPKSNLGDTLSSMDLNEAAAKNAVSNSIAREDYSTKASLYDSLKETKNTGFTAPGKKKDEKDDITCYEATSCIYEVNDKFSFVIRLEESDKPISNREIKKICPTCEKKFKNKYFYCPFDGTFLDEE